MKLSECPESGPPLCPLGEYEQHIAELKNEINTMITLLAKARDENQRLRKLLEWQSFMEIAPFWWRVDRKVLME